MAGLHRAPLGLNLWGTQRPGTSRLEGGAAWSQSTAHAKPLRTWREPALSLSLAADTGNRSRSLPVLQLQRPLPDPFRNRLLRKPGFRFRLPSYQEGTGRRGTHTSPWVSLDAVTSRRFGQKKVKIHTFCGPCEF